MRTAKTLEAEWRQVPKGSVSAGTKEDESITGRVWAAGSYHITGRAHLGVHFENYEQMTSLIFNFFFGPR
jgi:hypothetical protein